MTLDGTNTWVLRASADRPALVVDPGPLLEEHLRAVAGRAPVGTVLITHGHPDHVDGLDRLCELTGARLLRWPPGGPRDLDGLSVTTLPAPGHTADSVCYLVAAAGDQAVLTGDTILGRGSTVVAWPDGDLGDYLDTLRRLAGLDGVPVLPGHGPPLPDCAAAARAYLAHRMARLRQVEAAVAAGATTPQAVVETVYADVDRALWEAAEWSVRAQLAYLRRESPPEPAPLDPP
jgi:glyoxylase-like metal-dependent hydrolase (beta-lactamase superfamily II)